MEGRLQSASDSENSANNGPNVTGSIQFHMSLHETACIKLEVNKSLPGHVGMSSILHSVEFQKLEHHYSITGKYKFAIPAVSINCKCDCAGGDSICSLKDYHYKNCSSTSPLCYRTYKPFQSNAGCVYSSSPSELCCETNVHPYNDWAFQAIKLGQPSTMLVLRYRIFERLTKGWKKTVDKLVEVPLNSGLAKFELNTEHNIEIIAGGSKPNRQLEPGLYFWRIGDGINDRAVLHGGISLNDVDETSVDKLGWMRWENNAWAIRNGLVKLTQAQHVQVVNCKAQKYSAILNAEQFVMEAKDEKVLNFDLGHPIEADPWVGGVEIGARSVIVDHAEGTNLLLTLKAEAVPRAVYHISTFTGFNGSIQLDKESNRYLNLTFENARGSLIGQVYTTDSRTTMDLVFSVQTSDNENPSFKAVVTVPSSIDSPRYVCIHASGDLDSLQCQWLPYEAAPLNEYRVAHRWQQATSTCEGCNERGAEAFLVAMDPRQWLDGLNSPAEVGVFIFEAVLVFVVFLVSICMCTKCVIPLARWVICIPKIPTK
uniref:Tyrosine-protein kinase receptor n=1 Tax=Panagrellus redivivus TaxID=6233 RepID=A0A7E4UXP0_PANRE